MKAIALGGSSLGGLGPVLGTVELKVAFDCLT